MILPSVVCWHRLAVSANGSKDRVDGAYHLELVIPLLPGRSLGTATDGNVGVFAVP
jgi:hypothetical protein